MRRLRGWPRRRRLRLVSFNVLADEYFRLYGDYRHVKSALREKGARIRLLVELIASLKADIIGLQEVELELMEALEATGKWQLFWTPKESDVPDGCLLLVRKGLVVTDFETLAYSDGSGHVAQRIVCEDVVFANTHIRFERTDTSAHASLSQTGELLEFVGAGSAVILADGNDPPEGPAHALIEAAGFKNTCAGYPTAFVDGVSVARDWLAVRGIPSRRVRTKFRTEGIPTRRCPSDHIPVVADVETL